ncbi:MAG TPA: hypothetical protein VK116_13500, partial [Planctomycetota bacterium]|nr:hypothetical protein [Planctomycetota bacterium]
MSRRTTSENSADSRRSSDRKEPRAARAGESPLEKRTLYDSFRENLESLIIAVILAVIIRHFAVEAFEIPTG